MKIKAEYIWIDGQTPTAKLRSKTKIMDQGTEPPIWGFDGSSTQQATGDQSDCVLKPVAQFPDPVRGGENILVMCEVMNVDMTPHASNTRAALVESAENFGEFEPWFGMEQEYTFYEQSYDSLKYGQPLGFPPSGYPAPQGGYYCGVGASNAFGRECVERALDNFLYAGLNITGLNAEVAPGQWEYQIGAVDALEVSDHLWMSRYIMHKITEKYDCSVTFLPKPFADYAGSGLHTNVSTKEMREEGGLEHIYKACEKLRITHKKHIDLYGEGNNNRLTGRNETCSYEQYKYGVRNRGCSVRIPLSVYNDKKGYLEDRRPGSNADPYVITSLLMESIVFQEL